MPTYFIAASAVVDEEQLAAYESAAGASLGGRDIKLRVFSREAKAIEGEPPGERMVVLEFPDEAAFRDWYDSPEYQAVLPKRLAGTNGFAVLVDGVA